LCHFSSQIIVNDRIGHKERVKCNEDDKLGDINILVGLKIRIRAERIRLQLVNCILADYEIYHGTQVDMYPEDPSFRPYDNRGVHGMRERTVCHISD
jgi:ubiquitin-like protein 5